MVAPSSVLRLVWPCWIAAITFIAFIEEVGALQSPYQLNMRNRGSRSNYQHGLQATCNSKEQEQAYWKLPRLYVGARQSMNSIIELTSGALVPLSPEQAHYLTNVMRILKKGKNNRQKQQSRENDNDDVTTGRECVRIFNGRHGEWLAKVQVLPQQQTEYSTGGKGRSKKRGRSHRQSEDISLVAECILQLRTQDYNENERPWILFVPLKKQPRTKIMIEKCTELGVGRLIPVASDRMEGGAALALLGSHSNEGSPDVGHSNQNESHSSNVRFDKLELQCIEASEQCERLDIPIITNDAYLTRRESSQNRLSTIQDLMKQLCSDWEESQKLNEGRDEDNSVGKLKHSGARVLLICRERGAGGYAKEGNSRVVPVLQALHDNPKITFLIGPEGGWSFEEESMFDEVCLKYDGKDNAPVQCISLGPSVLRAETACMMAIGAWALVNDSDSQ